MIKVRDYVKKWGRGMGKAVARTKFLTLSMSRSGTHYLAHCLGNHPQVFMHRSEGNSKKMRVFAHLPHDRADWIEELMDTCWFRPGYDAAGEMFHHTEWQSVVGHATKNRAKLIVLTRTNVLRPAISHAVLRKAKHGEIDRYRYHSFKEAKPGQITVSPGSLEKLIRFYYDQRDLVIGMYQDYEAPKMHVKYEDIIGPNNQIPVGEHYRICSFLNIDPEYNLYTRLQRCNPEPASKLLANYDEHREYFADKKWDRYFEMDEENEGYG